jgi:hypothetical protein
MADTRRVNPEYQLDVDVMILEYLLYQAIRSSWKAPSNSPQNGKSTPDDTESERTSQAFDGELALCKQIISPFTYG